MSNRDSGKGIDTKNWSLDEKPERTSILEILGFTIVYPLCIAGTVIKNTFLYLPRKIANIANQAAGYDDDQDSTPAERRHSNYNN